MLLAKGAPKDAKGIMFSTVACMHFVMFKNLSFPLERMIPGRPRSARNAKSAFLDPATAYTYGPRTPLYFFYFSTASATALIISFYLFFVEPRRTPRLAGAGVYFLSFSISGGPFIFITCTKIHIKSSIYFLFLARSPPLDIRRAVHWTTLAITIAGGS